MKRISLERKFSSIEELLSNEDFLPYLENEVSSFINQRLNRPELPHGKRYVRDAVDTMLAEGEITTSFMLEYYPHIYHKISSMPSAKRDVVSHICSNAINKFIQETTIYVEEFSKLNVRDSKAKLKVLSIDNGEQKVKIEFLKKRETWNIGKLVKKIEDGTLWK